MNLPAEWEADDCWNEDDREFAEGMSAVLEQAYEAEEAGEVDTAMEALMARACVELSIIRNLLDSRMDDGKPAFLKEI